MAKFTKQKSNTMKTTKQTSKEEWQSELAKRKRVTLTMVAVKFAALLLAIGAAWYFNAWPAFTITILLQYARHLGNVISAKQSSDAALRRIYERTFDESTASAASE